MRRRIMKKAIVLLIVICMISSILISCDSEKPRDNTENSSNTETESTAVETESTVEDQFEAETKQYTEEELEILKVSDGELTAKFGITDFSVFNVYINQFGTGKISVSYSLLLEGIFTDEQYFVNLDNDLNIIESRASNIGEYSKYLNDGDFKAAFYAAKAKIDEKAASYNETPHYYFIEEEGYLCLCTELIVSIDPPNYETDDDGTVIDGGCGIDHEHIFFCERICPIQ